jgi:hypothetical protein
MVATEGAAGTSSAFDYSYLRARPTSWQSVPLPRPRVLSSSRGQDGTIQVVVGIDPVNAGNTSGDACGAVTGYEIVRAIGIDPGRDPRDWTVVQSVPSDGSGATAQFSVNCNDPSADEFYATRLLFADGQKGKWSAARSARTAIPPWPNRRIKSSQSEARGRRSRFRGRGHDPNRCHDVGDRRRSCARRDERRSELQSGEARVHLQRARLRLHRYGLGRDEPADLGPLHRGRGSEQQQRHLRVERVAVRGHQRQALDAGEPRRCARERLPTGFS